MKGAKSGGAKGRNADSKLAVKKSVPVKKGEKDPNKPKRPSSAFFVFMEDFRKTYKETHPNNKSVAAVGKAGGEKWKSMSDAEKAPYVKKAEGRKKEYEKTMLAYNKKQASGATETAAADDESDKSRSEINDEDGSGEDDEDEDDDE